MNEKLPHCRSVDEFEKIGRIQEGSYGIVYKGLKTKKNNTLKLFQQRIKKQKKLLL